MSKSTRPATLRGTTYRKETPAGTIYVILNEHEQQPFEVFLNVGKAGSEVAAISEAFGRLITLCLRTSSSPTERLQEVVNELRNIGGDRSLGFGANRVRSLPDGIAQVLAEHLGEEVVESLPLPTVLGDICPECGEATFLNVEGCRKCAQCGYSEC